MAARKRARRKTGTPRYGRSASKRVESAMRRRKKGTLKSGRGGKGGAVKSRKQAIAIGLSEARKKGAKVPRKRGASKRGASKRGASKRRGARKRSTRKRSTRKRRKSWRGSAAFLRPAVFTEEYAEGTYRNLAGTPCHQWARCLSGCAHYSPQSR